MADSRVVAMSAAASRLALSVLSESDVMRVHAAALALLGREAAAAESAAAQAPRSLVLAGRSPDCDLLVDGHGSWLAAGGPAALVRPGDGARPRAATAADLAAACRLADALPEVAFVVGPPVRVADLTLLGELVCCLASCRKHVQIATLRTETEAELAVRLAEALIGEPGGLAARPPISLRAQADGAAAGLVFARAGLPVGLVLEAEGAGSGDADLALALVRHHAAVLAGCRAIQDAVPGAPFLYMVPAAHDLPLAGGHEVDLFTPAAVQLAAYVGLPVCADALATGAADPGWQAGADNALAALGAVACGGAVITGAGTLAGGLEFSAEQLVMDAEVFSWTSRMAEGIPVDEDTTALEAIKSVGIGGNYLSQRHTRRHMRGVWRPRLLDRSPWDAWVAAGRPESPELARGLVEHLLASHEVAPLDAVVSDTLAGIVAEASESV